MRSAHSRYVFAALDNLIADHYIHSMRKKEPMSKFDTEDKIEREAERMMDRLDAAFLKEGSDMTIEEYHYQTEEIELWAKLRYRELRYA